MVDAASGAIEQDALSEGRGAFAEALHLVSLTQEDGLEVRLLGGMAVRALCPWTARGGTGQDLDLVSYSSTIAKLTNLLTSEGYIPDARFNALYGQKQMYFVSEKTGRPLDLILDRLEMCHTLDLAGRLHLVPTTLDPCDLLLSKLQIVELNEKDVHDIIQLLSTFPAHEGAYEVGTLELDRLSYVVGADWGWWRTVTLSLEKTRSLLTSDPGKYVPPHPVVDPLTQLDVLSKVAADCPKTIRWRMRAKVGERVPWYRLPEEIEH